MIKVDLSEENIKVWTVYKNIKGEEIFRVVTPNEYMRNIYYLQKKTGNGYKNVSSSENPLTFDRIVSKELNDSNEYK